MSKLSNCIEMIYLLHSRKKMKIKELAEALEVKERTIRIYKEEIETAGIRIKSEPGRYGGYSIDKGSLFPIVNLTMPEKESFYRAVDKIESSKRKEPMSDLQRAIEKVKASLSSKDEETKHIYYVNKSIPNPEFFEEQKFQKINEAIKKRNRVWIRYKEATRSEISERIIEPYGIIFYNEFYYCIAYCKLRKARRCLKLVRMQQIDVLNNEYFEISEDFNLKMIAESKELGLIKDRTKIRLKIYPPMAHVIQESIWATDQEIKVNKDESIYFSGTMSGKNSLKKWIIGMGECVKILEPEELKETIKAELNKMIKNID